MASYNIGDLVVLKSGSMRMVVEGVEDDAVACVWCNEGAIGRDRFDPRLLNAWEAREDHGSRDRKPYPPRDRDDRSSDDRPRKPRPGGDREERGGGGNRGRSWGDRDREERPRNTGWDGKPRDKKYFRKED